MRRWQYCEMGTNTPELRDSVELVGVFLDDDLVHLQRVAEPPLRLLLQRGVDQRVGPRVLPDVVQREEARLGRKAHLLLGLDPAPERTAVTGPLLDQIQEVGFVLRVGVFVRVPAPGLASGARGLGFAGPRGVCTTERQQEHHLHRPGECCRRAPFLAFDGPFLWPVNTVSEDCIITSGSPPQRRPPGGGTRPARLTALKSADRIPSKSVRAFH